MSMQQRLHLRLFLVAALFSLSACADNIIALNPNSPPEYQAPSDAKRVHIPVKVVVQGTDNMVFLFNGVFESGKYKLPYRTALEKIISARATATFDNPTPNPVNSCLLEVAAQSAVLKLRGKDEPAEFSTQIITKLKAPTGQVLAVKIFDTQKTAVFDGQNVPAAVWDSCDEIGNQIMRFYSTHPDVLAFAQASKSKVIAERPPEVETTSKIEFFEPNQSEPQPKPPAKELSTHQPSSQQQSKPKPAAKELSTHQAQAQQEHQAQPQQEPQPQPQPQPQHKPSRDSEEVLPLFGPKN